MNTLKFITVSFILVLLFSCNNPKENKVMSEKEKITAEIESLEKDIAKAEVLDKEKAQNIINKYLNYANKYPNDTITPEYLFKAAEIAMNSEQPHNSVRYLQKIEQEYPEYINYPTCIFMIGHIYDYYIKDFNKAKDYYNKYINDYPKHTFVEDAKSAVMFIGIEDEELIRVFEQINKHK